MQSKSKAGAGDRMDATLIKGSNFPIAMPPPRFIFDYELIRAADGTVEKWKSENQVTTEGAKDILDKYFANGTVPASWYVGLISSASYSTTPDIGDVAANLAAATNGWAEASASYAPNYDTPAGTARGGPISWSAASGTDLVSKAASATVDFTFNAAGTIKGAFIVSTGTRLGTTGILYSASLFGDKVIADNDILKVSVTVQQDLSYTP